MDPRKGTNGCLKKRRERRKELRERFHRLRHTIKILVLSANKSRLISLLTRRRDEIQGWEKE